MIKMGNCDPHLIGKKRERRLHETALVLSLGLSVYPQQTPKLPGSDTTRPAVLQAVLFLELILGPAINH